MVVDVFQHCFNEATGGSLASVIWVIAVWNFALSIFAAPVFFSRVLNFAIFISSNAESRQNKPKLGTARKHEVAPFTVSLFKGLHPHLTLLLPPPSPGCFLWSLCGILRHLSIWFMQPKMTTAAKMPGNTIKAVTAFSEWHFGYQRQFKFCGRKVRDAFHKLRP